MEWFYPYKITNDSTKALELWYNCTIFEKLLGEVEWPQK